MDKLVIYIVARTINEDFGTHIKTEQFFSKNAALSFQKRHGGLIYRQIFHISKVEKYAIDPAYY